MPYRRRQQDAAHAFAWPPTREDLDLIEIVDPDTLRPVHAQYNEPEQGPVQLDLLKSVTPVRPVRTPLPPPMPVNTSDAPQPTGFAPLVLIRRPQPPAATNVEGVDVQGAASPLLPFPRKRRLDPTWFVATGGLGAIALSAYFSLHPSPSTADVESAISTPVIAAPAPRLTARPLSLIELSWWLPITTPPAQTPPRQVARATPPRATPKVHAAKPAPAAVAPKPLVPSATTTGIAVYAAAPVSTPALERALAPAATSAPDVKPGPVMPAAGAERQQQIYAALREYERGYERLDANAVRAVWPSVDARALARAFRDLKSQTLVFDRCDIDVAHIQAVAACRGRATYETRAGEQASRTEPREWTFKLRRSDEAWQIVSASAR